jgi:hypothetical protein
VEFEVYLEFVTSSSSVVESGNYLQAHQNVSRRKIVDGLCLYLFV